MFGVSRFGKSTLILGTVLSTTWGCGGGSSNRVLSNNAGADAGALQETGGQTGGGAVGIGGSALASGGANSNGGSLSGGGTSPASGGSTGCAIGSETCACYGNDTCDSGLVCTSHFCVSLGTGGAPATDGGAGNVTGGTPATVGGAGNVTGGAQATGGTGDGSCAEPSLYCPCSTLGALNCLGHAQKVQLLCDGTKWIANGTCSGTLLCDTSAGPNQGLCTAPASQCVGRQSNESFCTGQTKYTCGPDLLAVTSKACPYLCTGSDCVGVCAPNSTGCLSNQTATCDSTGQWQPVSTCVHGCALGACCGATTPDVCGTSCVDLQTNNSNCGTCGHACTSGNTCQAGVCACPTGQTDCGTCVNLQTSKANCNACGTACPGTQTCSGGVCGTYNLIDNGDFSSGTTNWTLSTYSGASIAVSGGALCVSLTDYGYGTLGWGGATLSTPLSAGTSYTFSYTAWVTTGTLYTFTAKVGHSVSPYTADFTTSLDAPSATSTDFVHTFTQTAADTGAGIGFSIEAYSASATVCLQNVSLVAN